jgi:hypothetical protein
MSSFFDNNNADDDDDDDDRDYDRELALALQESYGKYEKEKVREVLRRAC